MPITILFINSPLEKYPPYGRKNNYDCMPPYGMLYCATVCMDLLGKEYVSVLDAEYYGLSPKQIAYEIDKLDPRYIALNVTSINIPVVIEIISYVKKNNSVIIGGTHAILSPEDLFDDSIIEKILFVCNGEGESVYQQFFSGVSVENISNICYYNGNKIVRNNFPILFPLDKLIVSREILPYDPNHWKNSNVIESYMLTSRGCPYSCSFCSANVICKNKIMLRSTEAITDELNYLKQLGVNYIRFIDDLFMINDKRLVSICDCIRKVGWNKLNFGFEATGRISTLNKIDSYCWQTMEQSGCKELEIGIESGSEKILKQMNKGYKFSDLFNVIDNALKYKIKIKAFIICGYLYETLDDLLETIMLCVKLKELAKDMIRFSAAPAKAYPKTFLYRELMSLPRMKDVDKYWFCFAQNVDLADYLGVDEPDAIAILKKRTRYNGMHVFNGTPISISEISGGANTSDVLKILCDIALISDGHKGIFFCN